MISLPVTRLVFCVGLILALNGASLGAPVFEFAFSVSPLDLDQIREIIPLGNLNPAGGHVFPTDHIYFDYGHKPGLAVLAPAAGTVRAIRDQLRGDLKIEIQVDANLAFYLAHLELESGVVVGSKLTAGQKLGRTSGKSMLDLGASDVRIHLAGLANPSRYPPSTIQCISPLALFAEPLRTLLYAKVTRKGEDKDGRIDLDIPGRLVGNWFQESLPAKDSSRGDQAFWAKQLSFAYDVHEPKDVRVSIGGTIAPAGLYAVDSGALDPAQVRVETGFVKYRLVRIGARGSDLLNLDSGLLLVRLLDEHKLKVEYFAGSLDDVKDFDQQASVYER